MEVRELGRVFESQRSDIFSFYTLSLCQLHAKCMAEEEFPYRPDIGVSQYANRVETPQQLIERLAIEDPKKRTEKVEAISKVRLQSN